MLRIPTKYFGKKLNGALSRRTGSISKLARRRGNRYISHNGSFNRGFFHIQSLNYDTQLLENI